MDPPDITTTGRLRKAQKNVLRTHTTAVSARQLYKLAQQILTTGSNQKGCCHRNESPRFHCILLSVGGVTAWWCETCPLDKISNNSTEVIVIITVWHKTDKHHHPEICFSNTVLDDHQEATITCSAGSHITLDIFSDF
ncbi:hypothetical protein COOONC_06450 [Cooperia oncophora]